MTPHVTAEEALGRKSANAEKGTGKGQPRASEVRSPCA